MEIDFQLRRALQDQLGADRYELWFGKGIRFELSDDRVRAIVPTTFLQEWLRRNFRGMLQTAAESVLGRKLPLDILVGQVDAAGPHASTCSEQRTPCSDPADAHLPLFAAPVVANEQTLYPVSTSVSFPRAHRSRESDVRVGSTLPTAQPTGDNENPDALPSRRKFASFDAFVVGETNRLAWTSARAVSERPGSWSPLLLYGPTGAGKTHLLEAIWSQLRQTSKRSRAIYLTSEQFTSYFVEAVRRSGLPNFRRKYRGVDLLLIDDLQFFSGKRATLVELLYTINTLVDEGRQIVLTADRPPSELGELGRELINRLHGGMICRIDAPDYDVRLGIVRQLAAAAGLAMSTELANFIACHVTSDARGLAGAINQLTVAQLASGKPLTLAAAQDTLAELIRHSVRSIRLRDIETAICDVFGLDRASLQSNRRTKDLAQPRMLAMWLARKHTRAALSEIGDYFGGRSHSTVVSAQQKVGSWMGEQATLRIADVQCSVDEAIRRVEQKLLG